MLSPPAERRKNMGAGAHHSASFVSPEMAALPPSAPIEETTEFDPARTGPRHLFGDRAAVLYVRPPTGATASPPALADLPLGGSVAGQFLVLEVETRAGDTPHTIVTLGTRGGRLTTAPFWPSQVHRLTGVTRGRVVEVRGLIGCWRDRRQLVVESLKLLPDDQISWPDLVPSIGDTSPWWHTLDSWRAQLSAPRLAGLLSSFFDDLHFRRRFEACPGSLTGHHAKLGGLLQHTCEVAHLALSVGHLTPGVDAELLLAGALLHDIGKIDSYHWEGPFETTTAGQVLGHVVLGVLLLDRMVHSNATPQCSAAELRLLHHLILSHHGQYAFGAPVLPMTLEAEILHHADLTSARTATMAEALTQGEHFSHGGELSSRSLWQLDHRRLWRGASDWGRDG